MKERFCIWLKENIDGFYVDYSIDVLDQRYTLEEATLMVNGKDITEGNYVMFARTVQYLPDYKAAYLPVRAVLEALGVEVTWDAARNVTLLTFADKKYLLDYKNISLIDEATSQELLVFPDGSYDTYHARCVDNRIIMDHPTLQAVIDRLGIEATITLDRETLSVDIH